MLPKLKNSNVERRFCEGRSEGGQFILKLKGGELVSVVSCGCRMGTVPRGGKVRTK